jgi:hypothetical protein
MCAHAVRYDRNVPLVPSAQPHDDDIDTLRSKLSVLDTALSERAAEIARAKSDLEAFRIRYRQEVGQLHEELDELQLANARAELIEIERKLEGERSGASATPTAPRPEPLPRFTSDSVRKLFRDVAKIIHPDLANDEHTRDRRHTLMAEANRAYALGDEERLRWILDAWERSPEAVQGADPVATRERIMRRIAQIEQQLDAFADEFAEMQDSPLSQLKAMVDEASGRGKDLVADMVRRLKRDIMAARNRLDAMQWTP